MGDAPTTVTAFDAVSTNGGTVSVNADGSFSYTPATNFNGLDTFTYTITAVPSALLGVVELSDGSDVVNGNSYTLAELRGMQFNAAANANGGPSTFSWSVIDSGGTATLAACGRII